MAWLPVVRYKPQVRQLRHELLRLHTNTEEFATMLCSHLKSLHHRMLAAQLCSGWMLGSMSS